VIVQNIAVLAVLLASVTFRVFSNWLLMRVIMPRAAMNDSRDSTWERNESSRTAGWMSPWPRQLVQ
jgi:hypothetical protein